MEEVDVTGEVCPRPALIVRDRLATLEAGEDLLVEGDYPPAENNLKRTCRKHGYEVVDAGADEEAGFALRITVTDDAAAER
ncbi:MAG: sulfurtransferase TusA family protein [Haloarculaceae archaeon]